MPSASVKTVSSVKPGLRLNTRAPKRASCHSVSSGRLRLTSRHSSLNRSTPPKLRSAVSRASSRLIPRLMFSSVSISRWKRSSRSISPSVRLILNSVRRLRVRLFGIPWSPLPCQLTGLHNLIDRRRQPLPIRGLFVELFAPGARQLVILRLAIVFGTAPFRRDPALVFQPVQRRIERALVDVQHARGRLLYPLRDAPAMHRLQRERLQNQHVERALQEIGLRFGHWLLLLDILQEAPL